MLFRQYLCHESIDLLRQFLSESYLLGLQKKGEYI
jgi:hypothetical protein